MVIYLSMEQARGFGRAKPSTRNLKYTAGLSIFTYIYQLKSN